MKKLLALFLAVLMLFSAVTVVNAADVTEAPSDTTATEPAEGEGNGDFDIDEIMGALENIPASSLKPMFKILKVFAKLAKVFLKIANVFGLDISDILEMIQDVVDDYNQGTEPAPETDVTEAPSVPAAA